MEITDVRMRLVSDRTDRLKAFCTVTFDEEFVIRDIKVVEGTNGFFIAMPSRKLSAPCPECRHKNQVRAKFCEECGKKLRLQPVSDNPDERMKLYRDIAHPITPAFREKLQNRIIETYETECDAVEPEDEVEAEAEVEVEERDAVEAEGEVEVEVEERDAPAPEQESSDDSGAAEFSDYDELIADLRGGVERASARERASADRSEGGSTERTQQRDNSGQSDDKQRRRRRPRRGRPSGDRPDAGQRSEPSAAPAVAVSEPKLSELDTQESELQEEESAFGRGVSNEPQRKVFSEPEEREPAFGSGLSDEPQSRGFSEPEEPEAASVPEPCRVEDEVAPQEEPATEPQTSDDGDDDSMPFGAGIL